MSGVLPAMLVLLGCRADDAADAVGLGAYGATGDTGLGGHSAPTGDTGPLVLTPAALEDGEWLPGDEVGTNQLLLGVNAFKMPMPGLSEEHESLFYSGNSWFNQSWVAAPSSTETRDGLGPLFHASGCSGCHFQDGRGAPPEEGAVGPLGALLVRISVPGVDGPVPDPVYGGQLADLALPGVDPELAAHIEWTVVPGRFADGSSYELLQPSLVIDEALYGPLPGDAMLSLRIAPQVIGLGLLEAIPAARLEALADPDDVDGDGVSGELQPSVDPRTGAPAYGRFGWKNEATTVEEQSAGAFLGDMGLTSWLQPAESCTSAQVACNEAIDGGQPEVEDHVLERVVLYARSLAVPARRDAGNEQVLLGKAVFAHLGCDTCHVPAHETGAFPPQPELEGQTIWPYTDLLLHDMGPGLADGRPVGVADGQEWRTPPLWGLGLVPDVNGHSRYLHDGRARSLEEAILWHGGEAEAAMEAYRAAPVDQRDALLRFLEDL